MSEQLFARFLAGETNTNGIRGEMSEVREDNALSDDSAEPRLPELPHPFSATEQ